MFKYFQEQFLLQNQNPEGRSIIPIFTCATDTENMKKVETIVQKKIIDLILATIGMNWNIFFNKNSTKHCILFMILISGAVWRNETGGWGWIVFPFHMCYWHWKYSIGVLHGRTENCEKNHGRIRNELTMEGYLFFPCALFWCIKHHIPNFNLNSLLYIIQ